MEAPHGFTLQGETLEENTATRRDPIVTLTARARHSRFLEIERSSDGSDGWLAGVRAAGVICLASNVYIPK